MESKNVVEEIKTKKKVETTIQEAKRVVKNIVIPAAPTNGFQFRKDWQMLVNSLDDLGVYFKVYFTTVMIF